MDVGRQIVKPISIGQFRDDLENAASEDVMNCKYLIVFNECEQ